MQISMKLVQGAQNWMLHFNEIKEKRGEKKENGS
jgi:hypothetical protein